MNQSIPVSRYALQREQEMKFGTQLLPEGVRFRLWAPRSAAVSLKLYDLDLVVPMMSLARGWFETEVELARPGMRYRFVLEDGTEVPDPASRYQPDDVDGPSEIIDPRAFPWSDAGWKGRPWEETVLYELHVGTFTHKGTFLAAIDRLDHLVELGVTAIELLPLADFPGGWNWGYDGVHLFAPDASYGRPEDLKALIDAAHARKLSVLLDVVYNHFGPKGNYLGIYAPLMTDKHHTPWGPAVNFDDEGSNVIRDFVIANARYWLNEFRFDGLRFDAVHEIQDTGPRHLLQDLAEHLRAATDGRHVHLIAENAKNQADWLKRHSDGAPWLYNAQWNDDVHHALHAAFSDESQWYYADFHGRTDLVGRALAEGFAWQGEYLEHEGLSRGEPSAYLPPTAFVSYAQNHDQTGNRPYGERMSALVSPEAMRAWAAIYLLSPQIPMLFMGEEWGARQAFPFFSDIGEDLADAIRQARADELKHFPASADHGPVPDPMSHATFMASKLVWEDAQAEEGAGYLAHYRQLIALRQAEIVPRLYGMGGNSGSYDVLTETVVQVRWTLGDGFVLSLIANLSAEPFHHPGIGGVTPLWVQGALSADQLGAWGVLFTLTAPE